MPRLSWLPLRPLLGIALAIGAGGGLLPGARLLSAQEVAATDAEPTAEEADAARKAFAAAEVEIKKQVGELMALQSEYKKNEFRGKEAEQAALAKKFEAAKEAAMAAGTKLEGAAIVVARAGMPKRGVTPDYDIAVPLYKEALRTCMGVVAAAIQTDRPQRALDLVDQLERAGAIAGETADTYMLGASAAMVLSRLDEAAAYLAKLEKVGGSPEKKQQLDELADAVKRERAKVAEEEAARAKDADANLPRVLIKTSKGDLLVELFEDQAPNTVANFITLVGEKFYDGTPFHRVIPEFMAQGGDPTGRGSGGPGYAIACETDLPGARKHFRGSLSMAHAGKDTGGSQFFLTFRPTEHLDGKHTVFGRVIEGDDVLAELQRTQNAEGRPIPGVKPDSIVSAEVVRKRDHEYKAETLPDPKK